MRTKLSAIVLVTLLAAGAVTAGAPPAGDPFLWLEKVDGSKPLSWVKQQDAATSTVLEAVPEFAPIHEKILAIYNSQDRIPYPAIRGRYVYNFWQDANHVQGIWRQIGRASCRERV